VTSSAVRIQIRDIGSYLGISFTGSVAVQRIMAALVVVELFKAERLVLQVTSSPKGHSYEATDPDDWRLLTFAEKSMLLDNGIQIPGVDIVRLYNREYKLFGLIWSGHSNTAKAPDGNIYIPTPNIAFGGQCVDLH
jgi:hypothetical protein